MNASRHVSKYLNPTTQRAYADSQEQQVEAPKPATPQLALLRRIKKVVFGPSVKTLEQALDRFDTIVDSLDGTDDDEQKAPKPTDKE
jgi:hypothetical protein